jgi:hypothetical protein
MAGWLGRINSGASVHYYSTDRVQTNLLVARATGNTDTGALFYNPFDSNYLATCGAVIRDQYFVGEHSIPADPIKTDGLTWLLSQRLPATPYDRSDALVQAGLWRARAQAGEVEPVLRECVAALMNQPRSWLALEAQLILDDFMLDYDSFRSLAVNDLATGYFASDFFYYLARGAGNGSDWPRYRSALKALTGISVTNGLNGSIVITGITVTVVFPTNNASILVTGTNADRAGDIRDLLVKYSYPAPIVRSSANGASGQMNLWFSKDTPGLDCSLEASTNLLTDPWQPLVLPVLDTNTVWSTEFNWPPGSLSGFYRLRTTPSAGYSPPWPPQ